MASASARQHEYGRLRVVYDDDVSYYALAPEATLADLAIIFASSSKVDDRRRLHSIQIMIVTEPNSELGAAAAFLASSDGSFMTASEVVVDGSLAQL